MYLFGRISQGTITTSGSDDLIAAGGTLDGVTLDGTLDMSSGGVGVMGGLTLNTDLYVSDYGLYFLDGSTVAVGPLVTSATIHLSGDNAHLYNTYPSQTVTIGRGITIAGENPNSYIGGPIDNLGTIEQNGPGLLVLTGVVNDGSIQASNGGDVVLDEYSTYTSMPVPWSNNADGTITATQGGEVDLYNEWTNHGTITVDSSSTVSLGILLLFQATLR